MSTVVSSDHADASLQVAVVLHSSAPTSHISAFDSSASSPCLNGFMLRCQTGRPRARTSADLMRRLIQMRASSLTSTYNTWLMACVLSARRHLFDF